jgi:hypothetical protein
MAPKSYKKRRSLRNVRKSRKRQQGGADSGATGYVGGLYGGLSDQMANADAHNLIQPMQSQSSMGPAQIGGKKYRRKSKRRRQRGGLAALTPADLSEPHSGGQHMDMSAGQKGGYFPALLERAVVPFGLIGLQRMMGKRVRSAKKSNFRRR